MALLLPDPCDSECPPDFKTKARAALPRTLTEVGPKDEDLRRALLQFIAEFADWDNCAKKPYLTAARALVRAAHNDDTLLVVDPFSGGGSIPLEALRIGCDVMASDLNPVACTILRALLEDLPKATEHTLDAIKNAGEAIELEARKELAAYYPMDAGGARPIAYLWARTIRCESPNCGAELPLVKSFWLAKKGGRQYALRSKVGANGSLDFEVFSPKREGEVQAGTVRQAKATCLVCGAVTAADRVRFQLRAQRGGADPIFGKNGDRVGGARLLTVVTIRGGVSGRVFRNPTEGDWTAVRASHERFSRIATAQEGGLTVIPDEYISTPSEREFAHGDAYYNFTPVLNYGVTRWSQLFTKRQLVALAFLSERVRVAARSRQEIGDLLAMAFNRVVMSGMSLTRWNATGEKMQHTFGRQALPMVWDFAEVVPIADAPGNWRSGYELVLEIANRSPRSASGQVQVHQADARKSLLPDGSASVFFTDPPYYDAVPYAALSDFFFVWLKRVIPETMKSWAIGSDGLTPKRQEIIDSLELLRAAPKDSAKQQGLEVKSREDFENGMALAFSDGYRTISKDGIGCVVFAHKSTEGWEALLSGMVRSGWTITASWPLATEMGSRLRARESAALGTSVHLICRPRAQEASVGDWAEVARELPVRVRGWMERLDKEGVRGADLVFACIGPAMEVYSRYSKVVDAEDREIPLGGDPEASDPHKQGYLAKVWEVVGRLALEQVLGKTGGAGSALEEDARLTALFLWALQGTGSDKAGSDTDALEPPEEADEGDEGTATKSARKSGFSLPYDVVRRFAQPLGIHLETWEGRIAEIEKGIVRLLPVSERVAQLFGAGGANAAAEDLEAGPARGVQLTLFPDQPPPAGPRPQKHEKKSKEKVDDKAAADRSKQVTTLDRVHAAMLLQQGGRTAALRNLLTEEKKRGSEFEKLANALAALYPRETEERRLVEAMLLAMPK